MTIEEMYGGLPRLKITKDILIRFELWSNIVDDEEYENVYGLTKRELHGYLSDFGEVFYHCSIAHFGFSAQDEAKLDSPRSGPL